MTLTTLTVAYLRRRPLTLALNVLLVAFSVGTLVLLLLLSMQANSLLMRDARGIGLVVAAEGSPLQAILSSIYGLDAPVGNVDVRDVRAIVQNRSIHRAIPLGLGDTYGGFDIVGTTRDYPEHYAAELANGEWWRDPLEATVGAAVAEQAGLRVGDFFASAHGAGSQAHDAHPIRVVGVMRQTGTVVDRRILTSLETVWEVHDSHGGKDSRQTHEAHDGNGDHGEPASNWLARPAHGADDRQITSLLLVFESPIAAALLGRSIGALPNVQAASPAFEIARLGRLLGGAVALAQSFGFGLGIAAVLTLFVTLYSALRERRYDLALFRAVGVGRGRLVAHVLLEGLVVSVLGLALGLVAGHMAAYAVGWALEADRGIAVTGALWHPLEGWIAVAVLVAGLLAAAIPAWQAYRTEVALVLGEGAM